MFASGGDVIKDATLTSESETATYDDETGQFEKSTSTVETKLLWTDGKSHFNNLEIVKENDLTCMVRGSDFQSAGPPEVGNRLSITGDDTVYRVIQVGHKDSGTGAFYYLHLRKGGSREDA